MKEVHDVKTFIVCPEGRTWYEVKAANAEMAYRCECSWFSPRHKIAIVDVETGITSMFTREIDRDGNLTNIVNHKLFTMAL